MPVIAGLDEAGYGPLLGPLIAAAVAVRVPGDVLSPQAARSGEPLPDLWKLWHGAVSRTAPKRGHAPWIGDSKAILQRGDRTEGEARLELGVLAALHAATGGELPADTAALVGRLAVRPPVVRGLPWYPAGTVGGATTTDSQATARPHPARSARHPLPPSEGEGPDIGGPTHGNRPASTPTGDEATPDPADAVRVPARRLPLRASDLRINDAGGTWADKLARTRCGLLPPRVRLVTESEFNAAFDGRPAGGDVSDEDGRRDPDDWCPNKADAHFGWVGELIRDLWDRHADEGVAACCDKLGGRDRYGPGLRRLFPEAEVKVLGESAEGSAYLITGPTGGAGGPGWMRLQFAPRSEEHCLPTALASMTAKLLRELAMADFNAWWSGRVAGLAPTAGYWQDGQRFLRDLDAAGGGGAGAPARGTWVRCR